MRANDPGTEHDGKTAAFEPHETNWRSFGLLFVTAARLLGCQLKLGWH